jgi:hypothetical protein
MDENRQPVAYQKGPNYKSEITKNGFVRPMTPYKDRAGGPPGGGSRYVAKLFPVRCVLLGGWRPFRPSSPYRHPWGEP